jgi:acyl carrier protein
VTLERRILDLIAQYAQTPPDGPILPALSLRRDLSIDSLSLVALTLRLGDELEVDLLNAGFDLGRLDTVGDLLAFGRSVRSDEGGGRA